MNHPAARKTVTIQEIAEMGIAVALGVALSYLSKAIWSMPMGGTLELGIIPVLYIALKWGWRDGLIAGLALGFVAMATDWYFVHPVQVVLDYPLPGLVLGLAGLPAFRRGNRWWAGILTGGILRYICHVASGIVFFAAYAKDWHMTPFWYSISYNGAYVVPSIAIAMLVIAALRRVKALWRDDTGALS
jgi:thiamine transporter